MSRVASVIPGVDRIGWAGRQVTLLAGGLVNAKQVLRGGGNHAGSPERRLGSSFQVQ